LFFVYYLDEQVFALHQGKTYKAKVNSNPLLFCVTFLFSADSRFEIRWRNKWMAIFYSLWWLE